MAIDMPPFDDVRVRQAMRLIVDRPQMLEQVASGYGFVGNDLYAPFDPGYDHSLPQRHQDIAQAKSLLKAAGHANLSVDLHTTNGAAGMVETATVFANQASGRGRQDQRDQRPELLREPVPQAGLLDRLLGHPRRTSTRCSRARCRTPRTTRRTGRRSRAPGPTSSRCTTRPWPTTDAAKRIEIEHEMQKLEYDIGGYIIPFFGGLIDGYAAKVQGAQAEQGHPQPG